MNRTVLPKPPNPAEYQNPVAWQQAAYLWMEQVKSRIETDSRINTTPIAPFAVGTYTLVNTVTGTDNLSNFVATMIVAFTKSGVVAPNSQRLS